MAERFRIGRVSIEGFRGFTKAQEIEIRNRHMFLIGPNGNGKTSIIEAIRWGLRGGRANEPVKNRGYGGDCRVEIDFERDGKEWRLSRTLNPGAGGSRPVLLDQDDVPHHVQDVLPGVDTVKSGEGTHVFFSAPQALRRKPGDLTDFEKPIFDYLGLTNPRVILSHLEEFLRGQEEEEHTLDGSVSDARKRIDSRLQELEDRRGRILESPPWDTGSGRTPTRQDTERKAQKLIRKIKTTEHETNVSQFSLGALVDAAERALEDRIDLRRRPLDNELEQLSERLSSLESMRTAHEDLVHKQQHLKEERERLLAVLGGTSMDGLQERVQKARQQAETRFLKHRLGEIAAELVNRTGGGNCPICGGVRDQEELGRAISSMLHEDGEGTDAGLRALEDRLNSAQQVESGVQELSREIDRLQGNFDAVLAAQDDQELTTALSEGRVSGYIDSVKARKASIAKQADDLDDWLRAVDRELKSLRDEAEFQQIQHDVRKLGGVDEDMRRVERAYDQLVTFGQSVRDIYDAVESTLTEALREKTPSVAEELTSVFSALTRHPHYDCLVFDEKKLPKLELYVASSNDSSRQKYPTDVLNGQAQSALALVPYFALSRAAATPTEVYLVLLDDPTRAFDRDHIQILIEQLADLGERVQVVVATHETDAFRDLLPETFKRESYVVVEPETWTNADGPKLVTKYG